MQTAAKAWAKCVLVCVLALPGLVAARVAGQIAVQNFTLHVTDAAGGPVAGAVGRDSGHNVMGQAGGDGRLTVRCVAPCHVRVEAAGFASRDVDVTADMPVVLEVAAAAERVTVTAYRAPLGEIESPASTRRLGEQALDQAAAVTMDSKLRQVPGVELFRRSSSLVANPSSQGMSLRGLGSTSASRTLLVMDEAPLNDPVGGWIHWEELPGLAVDSVEVVRGGASDLYGSSAIGGVVNMTLARPQPLLAEARSSWGGEGTYEESLRVDGKRGPWGGLAAGTALGTDGFIQEAPWQRGPVDINSNVHAQSGLVLGEHERGALRLSARLSGFNEARANGTPFQTNGTRLWRYATGADWHGSDGVEASLRLFGTAEHYRQTFSNITNRPDAAFPDCSYRCGETPTKSAQIADNELGAAAHASKQFTPWLLGMVGAEAYDVRVWDDETSLLGPIPALTDTNVHQRDSAAYVETLAQRQGWTLIGAARMDWFQNYDANQLAETAGAWAPGVPLVQFDQRVFDPRLGLSRRLGAHWALSGSGFRAFRAPSPSELYRATQVGSQLTKPNDALKSERATGWEAGVASERRWGTLRASYFLTEINRPISAVTVNPNSSPILLQRENLGQITSRGVSLDAEVAPRSWLALDGGYQYAHATVTHGVPGSNQDVGNWIPEVARNMASLNLRAFKPRFGTLVVQTRLSGRQFDDDANTYLLHGFFRMDAYAEHEFGQRVTFFAAGENLLDRTIEVAKTPTTTLGTRRVARVGITIRLAGTGH